MWVSDGISINHKADIYCNKRLHLWFMPLQPKMIEKTQL